MGRTRRPGDGSVAFDWEGVGARLAISGGSNVWANFSSNVGQSTKAS
jgi:hypothetical protein